MKYDAKNLKLKDVRDILLPGLYGYLGDDAIIEIDHANDCLRIMDGKTEIFKITREDLQGQEWKRRWSPRLIAYLEGKDGQQD